MTSSDGSIQRLAATDTPALIALVLGASAIGISPILVRLADVGPFASAFWRVALAVPVFWVWMSLERPKAGRTAVLKAAPLAVLAAGIFFAGDLIFWHLAILNTTVANATLFANFAPVIVALGAWLVLGERITGVFLLGLAAAMTGAFLVMGASYELDPSHLTGDAYGLVTAVFFGSYMLAVRKARSGVSAAALMFWSSLTTAFCLFLTAISLEDTIWPVGINGWLVLLALSWISHVGGQGLLAYGLGHLPASFSSLVILLEPVVAAIFGWLILSEAVTGMQAVGGTVILVGVLIARHASRPV